MDMECNIPENIWQGKINNNKRYCMQFDGETQPLYLDVFGIGLKSCPTTDQKQYKLTKRQSARQQHMQTHHICKQEPVKCQKKIQQHWKRGTRYATSGKEVPTLLFCKRGEYNNRSQTTSSNLQERCSNTISENAINSSPNIPVWSTNHIQTCTRSIHSRWFSRQNHQETKK